MNLADIPDIGIVFVEFQKLDRAEPVVLRFENVAALTLSQLVEPNPQAFLPGYAEQRFGTVAAAITWAEREYRGAKLTTYYGRCEHDSVVVRFVVEHETGVEALFDLYELPVAARAGDEKDDDGA